MSRPLDRARPLWELYVIEGHESGLVAVLTKIHHAVIDGLSGAEIMALLLDLTPEGREVPPPPDDDLADPPPSGLQMLGARAARPPALPGADAARAAEGDPEPRGHAVRRSSRAWARSRKVAGLLRPRRRRAPGPRRARRRSSTAASRRTGASSSASSRSTDFKAAKNAHGATVNDVVVSVCAGAVRRWLIEHDDLPDTPLVAQVPVSVRTGEQFGTYGNRILLMAAPLYTDEPDPVERLRKTHEALSEMKERHGALPAELLQDANNFIPPAVFARAARLTFALLDLAAPAGRPGTSSISNVPGPQFPLYMAGARLEANYPVSVITDGMGLNITVMSYMGHMDFGIVADRDQMPDVDVLMDYLREELEALES